MNNNILNKIKAFGMTNGMMISDLTSIANEFSIDLGHKIETKEIVKENYYPQFNEAIRKEASLMSIHYELFYCLEKSIRELVSSTIESVENTPEWWVSTRIPQNIQQEVGTRIQKETDSGISLRSTNELDYTTFGELSQIITNNWDIFGSILRSKKAVEKVMSSLNTLRGPIAHCSMLAEDEILRLQLTIRDWFRLME